MYIPFLKTRSSFFLRHFGDPRNISRDWHIILTFFFILITSTLIAHWFLSKSIIERNNTYEPSSTIPLTKEEVISALEIYASKENTFHTLISPEILETISSESIPAATSTGTTSFIQTFSEN